jgi:hypothetical protein
LIAADTPRNQIAIPQVDDDFHVLIEQIGLNNRHVHLARPHSNTDRRLLGDQSPDATARALENGVLG